MTPMIRLPAQRSFTIRPWLEAHNKAARQGFVGTDTASVVEWAGGSVAVIEGEPDNIKITTREDLAMAERITNRRML